MISDLPEDCDNSETVAGVTILYHDKKVIGYNLAQMPELPGGYHRLDAIKLRAINDRLLAAGLPKTEITDNPRINGEVTAKQEYPECTVLQVNIGEKTVQIVTKLKNIDLRQKVVVLLPGAVTGNGDIIRESKVYDHLSEGVLGSRYNILGDAQAQGVIYHLPEDTQVGSEFIEIAGA